MHEIDRLREARLNTGLPLSEVERLIVNNSVRRCQRSAWIRFTIGALLLPVVITPSVPGWARVLAALPMMALWLVGARFLLRAEDLRREIGDTL